MLIDLTLKVAKDNEMLVKAQSSPNKLVAMGHIGTHLDRYNFSDIPLEYFRSRGIVFDVEGIAEVSCNDIDMNAINAGDFVLFHTGHIMRNHYGSSSYFNGHPQLSHELIHALIAKKVHFIGIDCSGIRQSTEHTPADKLCEENGVYVIENLWDLSRLSGQLSTIYTMWLEEDNLTGLRVRVLAEQ